MSLSAPPSARSEPSRLGPVRLGPVRLWPVRLWALTASPAFLRRSAAGLVWALALTIVSGGAVRLTGSGLGCLDWPSCTSASVVAPLQYHAWIEFGNRLINAALTVAIVLVAVAALRRKPRRRDLGVLAWAQVAGVLAEVVLGGETVLHKLAPPFVMGHFLLAIALLVASVVLWHRCRQPEEPAGPFAGEPRPPTVARLVPGRRLVRPAQLVAARCMLALTFVVVVLGTVVTSTGPHAGAPDVPRFHFSLHTVAQLHGSSVEALLGLTVLTLWSLHRSGVGAAVLRRAEVLLVVLVAQAGVGYSQYLTGDPVVLVGIHLTGATAVVVAMTLFNLGLYERKPRAPSPAVAGASDRAPELARA
ncbi:MAG: COX15/CtaA family protein [Acidimicrobiales bacterium]